MDNKISTILVISVAIIVVGSLMMPIIINANDDAQVVKTNVGNYADVLEYSADANISLSFVGETLAYTINGETQTLTGYGALAISDQFRLGYNNTSVYWAYYDASGPHYGTAGISQFNLSVVDGVMTLTLGDTVISPLTWSKLAYLTNDVADGYKINFFFQGSTPLYVNSLDQIIATDVVNTQVVSFIDSAIKASTDTPITENITSAEVARAENMISVSGGPNGTLNVSFDGSDYGLKYVCVPAVVSSDTITSDAMALTFVAPVLVLVALIAAAVGMFARRY